MDGKRRLPAVFVHGCSDALRVISYLFREKDADGFLTKEPMRSLRFRQPSQLPDKIQDALVSVGIPHGPGEIADIDEDPGCRIKLLPAPAHEEGDALGEVLHAEDLPIRHPKSPDICEVGLDDWILDAELLHLHQALWNMLIVEDELAILDLLRVLTETIEMKVTCFVPVLCKELLDKRIVNSAGRRKGAKNNVFDATLNHFFEDLGLLVFCLASGHSHDAFP